ncbi:hypothetical protein MY4038_008098 [Beauveria bassiana]
MLNNDLEIVDVKNLAEGAKLDVALCAESRDSPGWRGIALRNSVGTGAPALYDRQYDPGANVDARAGRRGRWPRPLTVLPENEADKTRLRLSSSVNRSIYLESLMVVQNNMFESGKCVMGITDADWTVMCESGRRRYEEGLTLAEGQHGKVRQDAVRAGVLFDALHVETKVHNKLLCLPQRDLDEATKDVITLAEVLKQRAERMAKEAGSSCS